MTLSQCDFKACVTVFDSVFGVRVAVEGVELGSLGRVRSSGEGYLVDSTQWALSCVQEPAE